MREFTPEEVDQGIIAGAYFFYDEQQKGLYKRYLIKAHKKNGNIICEEVQV